jgi:hypothetical protein
MYEQALMKQHLEDQLRGKEEKMDLTRSLQRREAEDQVRYQGVLKDFEQRER